MERNEWQALNTLSFCRNLITGFFYVFVPIYMLSAHLPLSDIGLALGIGNLARLLTAPAIGTLNDLLGTRRLLQLSLLGLSAGAAGIALTNPAALSVSALLPPLVLFWVSNNALILSLEASLYKKTTRELVAGHVGEFNAVKAVAWGGGILVSGYLLLAYPFRTISLGLSVLAMLLLLLTLGVKHTVRVRFSLAEYVHELRKPSVLLLSLLIFIMAFEWGTEGVALPPVFSRQAGLDTAQIGVVSFAANMIYASVSFWAGRRLAARHHHVQARLVWRALMAGMLITCAASFAIFLSHDLAGALLARMVHNSGEAVISIAFGFLIGTTFSAERVGGANGVMNLISGSGMTAAAFASGALMGFGVGVPYLLVGSLFLCGAVISWFAQRRFR